MLAKQGVSLQTQLYLTILFVLSLSFILVASVFVNQQRSLMIAQAAHEVEHLSLLIEDLLESQADWSTMERILSPQLAFHDIALVDIAGESNSLVLQPDSAPDSPMHAIWQLPEIATTLTSKYEITVVANLDYIGDRLWQLVQQVCLLFLLCLALSLLVFSAIARLLFTPLRSVISLANAVVGKRFQRFEFATITKEFSLLQKALNHLIDAVSRTISEQTEFAEQLQQSMFIDTVTKLKNRKAFDAVFQNLHEDYRSHWILLVRLDGLESVNHQIGHREGDVLLQDVAQCLLRSFDKNSVYRLSGVEFAIDLSTIEMIESGKLAEIETELMGLSAVLPVRYLFAAARCETNMESKNVLMALDARLMERRLNEDIPVLVEGRMPVYEQYSSWKEVIQDLIATQSISIDVQYAAELSGDGDTYAELFARFNLSQHVDVAALFSLADRYDLSAQLDRAVIQKALTSPLTQGTKFAINISQRTLVSGDFFDWLAQFSEAIKNRTLVLEISEESVVNYPVVAKSFVESADQLGVQICIDRFGSSMQSLRYWQNLNVHFVKIDAGYVDEVVKNDKDAILLRYITSMAHNAGMKVLVSQLQEQNLIGICRELSIDMVQGRAIVPPAPYII